MSFDVDAKSLAMSSHVGRSTFTVAGWKNADEKKRFYSKVQM